MARTTQSESTDLVALTPQGRELMDTLGIRFADPSEISIEVAGRLAGAQTPEELFGDNGPAGLRDHFGVPFYVRKVQYLPGRYEQGFGFYALITAVHAVTDEPLTFTSGSANVLIQLARAAQMGWFDRPLTAKPTDEPTANGYYPYRLVFGERV